MQNNIFPTRFLILLVVVAMTKSLLAVDGDPVAVRNWPGGVVSVETHWGLHLVIDPERNWAKHLEREADQIVSPSDGIDHYLFRKPNASNVSWLPAGDVNSKDSNAVRVQTVRHFGNEPALQIDVDGIQIMYVPEKWFNAQSDQDSFTINLQDIASPDLLVLDTQDLNQLKGKATGFLIRFGKPKAILLNRIDVAEQPKVDSLGGRFGQGVLAVQSDHNTLALSSAETDEPLRVFVTTDTPWAMPASLSGLFEAMEKANRDSQAVFAELSANQMNFRPANGTHTPRWNTEHMMGRQLLFFSQIYHARNPAIPIMDLNPKQMPPDYAFAHPDWDGGEEARQMQRVSEFTRRYAYLLDGVPRDEQAPGSRWTLRGLLGQMQRHYGEHTANTVKKFDLPGWPKE